MICPKKEMTESNTKQSRNIWARPGMEVTFRAELMPGRDSEKRTFRVKEVFANGRVSLEDFAGEHKESEFEPINYNE